MSAKAQSLAAELLNALQVQGFTCSTSFDSDGLPLVRVGSNPAAGQQTALIKIAEIAVLGTDAVGLTPKVYANHVAQLVLETSSVANLSLVTEANELLILCTLAQRGLKTELYMSANGNSTGPEDITAGNLKQTWYPDPKWKTLLSQ